MNTRSYLSGIFLLVASGLIACGPSQADVDAKSTELALAVFATETKIASEIFATQTAAVPTNTATATLAPTSASTPTSTPIPTRQPTKTPVCMSADKVTSQDEGKTIVVCGRVIREGELNCPSCEHGVYSYLYFEGGFNIISYEWNFSSSMVGLCIMASDKVELLAGNPVFVFGSAEGYAGSTCTWDADGTKRCASGDYFRAGDECK